VVCENPHIHSSPLHEFIAVVLLLTFRTGGKELRQSLPLNFDSFGTSRLVLVVAIRESGQFATHRTGGARPSRGAT
jgi:hypothetical protein